VGATAHQTLRLQVVDHHRGVWSVDARCSRYQYPGPTRSRSDTSRIRAAVRLARRYKEMSAPISP
jgi:hypothetical protein